MSVHEEPVGTLQRDVEKMPKTTIRLSILFKFQK